MEKGFFHELEEIPFFSRDDFNELLWEYLRELNARPLTGKNYSRYDKWQEEKLNLLPLPSMQYQYTERKEAKVSGDFCVRFDKMEMAPCGRRPPQIAL